MKINSENLKWCVKTLLTFALIVEAGDNQACFLSSIYFPVPLKERASTPQKRESKAKGGVFEKCVLMKHNSRKPH